MGRMEQLALFRRILRLHQMKLPEVPRAVGDRYVRQEFRSFKDPTPKQEREFMAQWFQYAEHLELEADLFGLGRDLADVDMTSLSEDQKLQLSKLQESVQNMQHDIAKPKSDRTN